MSRFAVVGPIHPLRGGIAQHTAGVVEEARRRRHEVCVRSYRRQYPGILFPGRSQFSPEAVGPEVARTALASIDSLSPLSWRRTARELMAFRPDLVLLQRWHPFFAPALAAIARPARRSGARIVWMVHNARPHEGRGLWRPLLTWGMRANDRVLVHAVAERDALTALGVVSPATVVPMPAPTEVVRADAQGARARLGLVANERLFLFLGHVRAYKGVDVLLEALRRLAIDGPAWRAVIAGEWYVDRAAADALVERAPLAGRVRIDDRFVSQRELADYLAAATVVVLPYRSGSQSAVVPLAYAHGRPVITTRVGGLPEVVEEGQTGLLVVPGDTDDLARALEEVRRGRAFSSGAIERAHAAASYGALVEALEAIVHSVDIP